MEDFLVPVAGLIILLFGAGWFIDTYPGIFWTIVLVAIGGFVGHMLTKKAQAEKVRYAAEAAKQLSFQQQLLAVCNEALVAYEDIPKDLLTAEELLDVAEAEFQESAFSPFWDSIERAAGKFGAVSESIELIADRSNKDRIFANAYTGRPPPFPITSALKDRF